MLDTAVWRGDCAGVNGLRETTLTDIGCSAAMHETLVVLQRVDGSR